MDNDLETRDSFVKPSQQYQAYENSNGDEDDDKRK